ncbi:L-ascorbate oxidase homolog [Asparagus officinalis]|uniref:L-ascorbate oxidase homolog n=1 Tax=Asparagus officinalis TaxID=4686 RepID=UPI00098E113F|nr:L-ascorbate oxidase homolog [Asparagus officinalis]
MAQRAHAIALLALVAILAIANAEDPYIFFDWKITYGTLSPLGVPQQVILINGEFPGPNINSTTNNNVVINIFNDLKEPFLLSWNGVQQRKNSWQDGVPGTNCPIQPGTNVTYHFQVKDQIGSFFLSYHLPSACRRAAEASSGLRHQAPCAPHPRSPFDGPADDYTVIIGDWYTKSHDSLASILDKGRSIAKPAGILINGKSGKDDKNPLFTMEAGKTYRYRICNVGIKTSLNFRIQGHSMILVEMDGSHTVQNAYESLDVHVGQCLSVLVKAEQKPMDYYMVASTRFVKYDLSATGIIRYAGSNTPPSTELPKAPNGWEWSCGRSAGNLTASAAPVPTHKVHTNIRAIQHTRTMREDEAPKAGGGEITAIAPNVLNAEHRTYIEIIIENAERSPNFFHLDGYSFFAVGMGGGTWAPEKRSTYNLLDAVSRHTIQVYPKSWTAIMTSFDNVGMWNFRSELWERRYLGQQMYISVLNTARSLRDEYNMLPETLLCGSVAGLPIPAPYT